MAPPETAEATASQATDSPMAELDADVSPIVEKPRNGGVITQTAAGDGAYQPEARPGVIRRRDPIDLPVLDDPVWFEWILSIVINGQEVSDGTLVLENASLDLLAVPVDQALRWRLRVGAQAAIDIGGELFLPLQNLDGAEIDFDRNALVLSVQLPASGFTPFDLALDRRSNLPPTASTGLFADYDLLVNAGETLPTRVDGLFEVGAFSDVGVVTSTFRAADLAGANDLVRLETTLTRDFPSDRRSIRLGDNFSPSDELAGGARFAGLQWGTNFALDPTFVQFPTPAIGGLAEQSSVVDVIVDNLTRATEDVPPGPFAITNVPVVTGRGEVQLRVTDLLGRERLTTQSYYVSDRLLKPGLHDFSYNIGALRDDFGQTSNNYGSLFASGLHRYGWSDALTVQAVVEASKDTVRGSVGGRLKVGNYGLFSAAGSLSRHDDNGTGWAANVLYEYLSGPFSFSVRSSLFDNEFATVARRDQGVSRTDQANLGVQLGDFGRLSLLWLNRVVDDATDTSLVSANYSFPAGPGAVNLRLGQALSPDEETALTASFAMPLGPARSITASVERQNRAAQAQTSYRRGRGAADIGFDYRLAANVGEDTNRFDGRLAYTASVAAGSIDVQRFDGDNNVRGNLSGSLALVDGSLMASRRLGRAFGLVTVPGHENVRVYSDNRLVGRTNQAGRLLVPNLRPFERNRLRFAVDDLPLSSSFGAHEIEVAPYDQTGVSVAFDVRALDEVTARLYDPAGEPLAAGLALASNDQSVTVRVGRDGFAHVRGAWAEPVLVQSAGADIGCELPVPARDELLPDLGDLTCTAR